MSITTIAGLTGKVAVAPVVGNAFTTTSAFVLYGDGFAGEVEQAILYRLGPSGAYSPATNKDGIIKVKDYPNMVYVEAPGTYRPSKTATVADSYVGYEEV